MNNLNLLIVGWKHVLWAINFENITIGVKVIHSFSLMPRFKTVNLCYIENPVMDTVKYISFKKTAGLINCKNFNSVRF